MTSSTPVTEHSLISGFLISNTHLVDSLPLKTFEGLFPPAFRQHKDIKIIHAHLTNKRNKLRSQVSKNIARHVQQPFDEPLIVQEDVHGPLVLEIGNGSKTIRLAQALAIVRKEEDDLEHHLRDIKEECLNLIDHVESQIGDLSDLRYGGGRQTIREPLSEKVEAVVREIQELVQTCNNL